MIFGQVSDDRKVRVFSLSAAFLEPFQNQPPAWGYAGLGLFTFKRCVGVETPILCDDLLWRPAGDLQVGQGIVGFDEEAEEMFRGIRWGEVLHNETEEAETYVVELEDGTLLYATPDHPWLVRFGTTENRLHWRQTEDLGVTDRGNSVHLLRPFGPVWEKDATYEGGFLSAAYDGEGCLDRRNGVNFVQVDNPMLRQVEKFLFSRGFPYRKSERMKIEGRQQVYALSTWGRENLFRLLGILQPPRLLERFRQHLREYGGGLLRCAPKNYVRVVRVSPAGLRRVAVLSTSVGTHFTGGFASHNTYSRLKPDGLSEDWWETCQRVVEGCFNIQKIHCRQMGLPWNEPKAQKSAQEMFARLFEFKWTPPGRGLWMMGTDLVYERGSASLQNCAYVSSEGLAEDFAAPFCFLMDMSMLGVGVGGDTRGAGKVKVQAPKTISEPHVVADSREGWVDLLRIVLNSFVGKGAYPSIIDYSKVRGRGIPLKTFGGTASGPGPLQDMVAGITRVLLPDGVKVRFEVAADQEKGTIDKASVRFTGEGEPAKITSSQIVDLFNYIGKCIVAGGIRRSSEIMFGESTDQEFLKLKQDKKALADRRWASNNSIFGYAGMDYRPLVDAVSVNGEPGVFWIENARKFSRMQGPGDNKDWRVMGTNPCGEMSLESYESCNLTETYPARHDSYEDFERTLKMAYLYAKTVTLVPTHDMRANAVMTRNRRIGCSMSGIIQAMVKLGRRQFFQWCDQGYGYLQRLDRVYSDWLGIPLSIKMSTVKPSGTVSLLMGATPGIHYPHAPYYIRHVRVANTSALVDLARKAGHPVYEDPYAPDTSVVGFPIKEEHYIKGKGEVTVWEQFVNAVDMQRRWADNQVSVTVTFRPEETQDLRTCLETFEDRLKGVSMLPAKEGEGKSYLYPPYLQIDEVVYKDMMARITPMALTESSHDVDDNLCSGDKCLIG